MWVPGKFKLLYTKFCLVELFSFWQKHIESLQKLAELVIGQVLCYRRWRLMKTNQSFALCNLYTYKFPVSVLDNYVDKSLYTYWLPILPRLPIPSKGNLSTLHILTPTYPDFLLCSVGNNENRNSFKYIGFIYLSYFFVQLN